MFSFYFIFIRVCDEDKSGPDVEPLREHARERIYHIISGMVLAQNCPNTEIIKICVLEHNCHK